mmetsp:Transcript_6470/g.20972  ORF Transcript_6470/g.20972 Transcript_6470/m.20972 type:complete len:388 (-) Transcript_6470:104-1267(-)|eukprot:CAMPEP_0170729796 /NCGR_PEP_ID=MMETSP0437-20130122/201_1 /TAXON_ID=0 /ORGANISM="Sexangularia sp." /LENGTH=387 /DNA_ID=CAMNT_0011067973 /DNA_START=29 /DNA_END=1192 /DNA_ORIENTATION=-
MKHFSFTLFALLLLSGSVFGDNADTVAAKKERFGGQTGDKGYRFSVVKFPASNPHSIQFTGVRRDREEKTRTAIRFGASVLGFPRIRASRIDQAAGEGAEASFFRLGLLSAIFYEEAEGSADGFEPGVDEVVHRVPLGTRVRDLDAWTRSQSEVDGTHTFSATRCGPSEDPTCFGIDVVVSTEAKEVEVNNVTKSFVYPTGVETIVRLTNIHWPTNSSRLAITSFVGAKRLSRSVDSTGDETSEDEVEALGDTEEEEAGEAVLTVGEEEGGEAEGGRIRYARTVTCLDSPDDTEGTAATVVRSAFQRTMPKGKGESDADADIGEVADEANESTERRAYVVFSYICDEQPWGLQWDPTLEVGDDGEPSGAATVATSAAVIIFAALNMA